MTTRTKINALRRAFYDTASPLAYRGARRLKQYAKRKGIDPSTVDEWLRQQPAHVLHKQPVRRFQRSKIFAPYPHALWEADLTYVDRLSAANDGYRYLLAVIDVFSKVAAVEPLRIRTAEATAEAFKRIVRTIGVTPKQLRTDNGREFTGVDFQRLMRSMDIHHYTSNEDDIKAGVVERFHRTFKLLIYKHLTANKTNRYIGELQNLVKSYNSAVHRTIGMAPNEVTTKNQHVVFERIYGAERRSTAARAPRFQVGDAVLITVPWTKFRRGYSEMWNREIFRVVDIKRHFPYRYVIADVNGDHIKGSFYENELQLVDETISF